MGSWSWNLRPQFFLGAPGVLWGSSVKHKEHHGILDWWSWPCCLRSSLVFWSSSEHDDLVTCLT